MLVRLHVISFKLLDIPIVRWAETLSKLELTVALLYFLAQGCSPSWSFVSSFRTTLFSFAAQPLFSIARSAPSCTMKATDCNLLCSSLNFVVRLWDVCYLVSVAQYLYPFVLWTEGFLFANCLKGFISLRWNQWLLLLLTSVGPMGFRSSFKFPFCACVVSLIEAGVGCYSGLGLQGAMQRCHRLSH